MGIKVHRVYDEAHAAMEAGKINLCNETSPNHRTHRRTSLETYNKQHETQAVRKITTL